MLDFEDSPPPRDLVIVMYFFISLQKHVFAFNPSYPIFQKFYSISRSTGPRSFDVMSKVPQIMLI